MNTPKHYAIDPQPVKPKLPKPTRKPNAKAAEEAEAAYEARRIADARAIWGEDWCET